MKSQRVVPSLLIPWHGIDGDVVVHENRPDNPRLDTKAKPLKYNGLTKVWRGSTFRCDRELMRDTSVPLWITEGARKVDAATTAGLCCIGLAGVDGWLTKVSHSLTGATSR